jgi:hypothetical protein
MTKATKLIKESGIAEVAKTLISNDTVLLRLHG